jgi:mannose-6-phosphate isomerase
MLYPMRCVPAYKQALWGGNRLKSVLGKAYDGDKMAESWELSCHQDGLSAVGNGAYAGMTLARVLGENPAFMHAGAAAGERFPLLIKFIDAARDLSIQVHPTPQAADAAKGYEPKTEIWAVMDAADGASLFLGFKRRVSADELRQSARDGSVTTLLNRVEAKPGDVFHVPAGTVHAIGGGLLIAEIQQNANTTYRVYDHMRRDDRGNLRPLHIEEAVGAAELGPTTARPARAEAIERTQGYRRESVFDSPLFTTEQITLDGEAALAATGESFEALLWIDGRADILHDGARYPAQKGECYFMPAGMGQYAIAGRCCVLRSRVPTKSKGEWI